MSLQVNRNIIGVLLSYSTKMGRAIDFKSLTASVNSFSIANEDGSHREKK